MMPDYPLLAKAIKLLEAIAEDCETKGDAEHAWRRCRHCLGVAELETKNARRLIREVLAELDRGEVRRQKRVRYLENRAAGGA